MPHLYFVRHGQTIWNVENKICGSTDIALTPLGHEQAIAAGKLILERQYPVDASSRYGKTHCRSDRLASVCRTTVTGAEFRQV